MRIEHFAYQVADPAASADWYIKHLGFVLKRSADGAAPVRFLADQSGTIMFELYHNPDIPVPDYRAMDALVHHIAFACDNVAGTAERLAAVGATIELAPTQAANGDDLAMLRDPWGLAVQLVKRSSPLV